MKIEIDKPVIPQFIADAITDVVRYGGNLSTLYSVAFDHPLHDWLYKNEDIQIEREVVLATAFIHGYEVEKEPLYYAKSKLTGQYLGNKDIGIGSCVQQPFWFFDKGHLQIEKLPKEVFKKVYGLDDTNAYFEKVE